MNWPAFAPLRRGKPGGASVGLQLVARASCPCESEHTGKSVRTGETPVPLWPAQSRGWIREFLQGIVILFSLAIFSGCMRHDPPADLTIVNYSEPQSLDPAIITAQPDMRIAEGMFEGVNPRGPENRARHSRLGGPMGNFAGWAKLHVSSAHEPDMVHRGTNPRGGRGLFLDSHPRSRHRLGLCGPIILREKCGGFQRRGKPTARPWV